MITKLLGDTTWIITKRFVPPDNVDTIVMRDNVVKVDTMVSQAPYEKVDCTHEPHSYFNIVDGEIVKFHVNAAGDTFIMDNLLSVKSVNFEQPKKVEIPQLMIEPSTSKYLQPGDTRSASEIIGVIPKVESIKLSKPEHEYDPMAKGMLLTFMLCVTSLYVVRSVHIWAEMVIKIRNVVAS
jgi:hypothetical protein